MSNININVKSDVKDLSNSVEIGIRKSFNEAGNLLVREAIKLMNEPKTGRLYTVYIGRRKKLHIASQAGQAPAIITGNLKRSVRVKYAGGDTLRFGAGDSKARYAKYLELGTQKMEARPYLIASIKNSEKDIYTRFKMNIHSELVK